MAARENQGLQIALILFVMITVVLAVTTYIYYRKAEEKIKEAQAANDASKTANSNAEANKNAAELLKVMLGASTKNAAEIDSIRKTLMASTSPVKEEIEKIQKKYDSDMQVFAADFAADKNKDYTTLPDHLVAIISSKNAAIADGLSREATLRDERDKAVKGEADKTKAAEASAQVAFADKEKVKTDYDADRTRFTSETADLGAKMDAKAKELKAATDVFTATKATLDTQVNTLSKDKEMLQGKLKGMIEPVFDVPDGVLTWVNQRTNVVWINLGSGDGLRRQITFSVFPKGATNLKPKDAKGSIEVTKIIDDHLAECRIVDSQDADPLLPGDLAFSPVWHPGQTLHFALAGFIDYNNDGKSDRQLVTSVIQMNGGIIDSEVGDDGKLTGNMSVDTRYLVVGKPPTEKSSSEAQNGYTQIQTKAKDLGVEQISVAKLLDLMGYRGEVNTVSLGRGASGDDFKAKAEGGVVRKSDGDTSGIFKKRSAPARGKDGAF